MKRRFQCDTSRRDVEIKTVWDRLYSYGGMQADHIHIWRERLRAASYRSVFPFRDGTGREGWKCREAAADVFRAGFGDAFSAKMAEPVFFCAKCLRNCSGGLNGCPHM